MGELSGKGELGAGSNPGMCLAPAPEQGAELHPQGNLEKKESSFLGRRKEWVWAALSSRGVLGKPLEPCRAVPECFPNVWGGIATSGLRKV